MDEIKKLFYLRQKTLVDFANSDIGRKYLELEGFPHKVVEVGTNHVSTLVGRNKLKGKFWVGDNQVAKILGLALTSQEIIKDYSIPSFLHYLDIKRDTYPLIQFTTTNYNTGAGDGYCEATSTVWATVRGAASSASADYTADNINLYNQLSGSDYVIDRGFMPSDTSGIGSGTVTAATFNGYVYQSHDDDTTGWDLCATNQAATTQVVTGDYNDVTFTSLGNKMTADLTLNQYGVWTITDLTKISTSGTTKIGMIGKRDLDNSAPTGNNNMAFYTSERATNKPYYAVTYTLPGGCLFYAQL